jgi:hypothetical protein
MARNGARERLALLLAGGASVIAAAKKTNIGLRTAFRWLADPAFQARIVELRNEASGRALGRLSLTMNSAARKLAKLIASTDERIALSAARSILELRGKLHETDEFERRLSAVEQAVRRRSELSHGTNGTAARSLPDMGPERNGST